jgi:hypothetical protein
MAKALLRALQNLEQLAAFSRNDSKYPTHAISLAKQL